MAKKAKNAGLAALMAGGGGGGGGGMGMPAIPGMRKPTRGALGGAAPVGARTRMPPTIAAAGGRGGKRTAKPTTKRKVSKK
jgi:hypothetical protein